MSLRQSLCPRFLWLVLLIALVPLPAATQQAWLPLKADDGSVIANHRVPTELESEIERLPGIVVVGNPKGDVTLAEFYDLNCPFCRTASIDLAELLRSDRELKVVLVPFPVLGVPSIQAGRVELVLARVATPAQFYQFHRKIYAGRGVVDGERALAVARELGFAPERIVEQANATAVTETMKAHVRLGDRLALSATPAYVIKGIAILGHPGRDALRKIIASIRRCDKLVC